MFEKYDFYSMKIPRFIHPTESIVKFKVDIYNRETRIKHKHVRRVCINDPRCCIYRDKKYLIEYREIRSVPELWQSRATMHRSNWLASPGRNLIAASHVRGYSINLRNLRARVTMEPAGIAIRLIPG